MNSSDSAAVLPPASPLSRRLGVAPGTIKLAVLNTLCFLTMFVIAPVLAQLVREPFDLDNSGTAMFMAIHSLAGMIFYLVGGIVTDRWGRRVPLIILGLIGSGTTTALIPHIPVFGWLLVLRAFDGIFGALALGLIMTRALDIAGPENRNRSMAVLSISIALGSILAQVFAGIFAGHLKLLFGLVGSMLIVGGLWMTTDLKRRENIEPAVPGLKPILKAVFATPRLAPALVFAFVDKFTFGTLAQLTSLAVEDLFGHETRTASLVLLGFWITFSLFCFPGGRLCDRFGSLAMLISASALYGLSIAALGWVNLPGFAVMMVAAGLFCALQYVPSVSLVGEVAAPSDRGVSMAAWNTVGSVGVFMGLVVSGKLSDTSYKLAYGFAGGLEIVVAAFALILVLWLRSPSAAALRWKKSSAGSDT